jgi:chitin synthase
MNTTACHLSMNEHNVYNSFKNQGAPKPQGRFDKDARVYYNWQDIKPESSETIYNGYYHPIFFAV